MANFVGAGTGVTIATGSGAVTAAGSGVAVGDIVVLQVLQDGVTGSAVSLSGISGVANLAGTASSLTTLAASQAVGTLALQHLWIGRATSTTVTVTVATTGDDLYYRIYVFRGVLRTATTLATILENSTAGTVTNATGTVAAIADTGVTSIGTDRLAVNFVAVDDDNPVGPFTGMTGGTWSEAIAEFASATGTDGCIQLQIADLSAAGTINGGSFTMSAADNWGVVGFAFIPVAVTADTATVGLVFTPSASDTYTPSVPTVDSGTGVLVLTASGVDVYAPSVPTTDSGTVSLLLTVLTTTAFNTYAETGAVLDNFNRADQEPPGGIWGPEPVSSAHTALQVVGNRLSGTVLGNNSGRIAGVDYGPDVFATFEIGTAGNEVMGIYLRIQEVGDTPTAYQITIDLNGLIVMYRQPGGNFLGSVACPAGLVSGDKFGVEMVGSRLRAYVNDISTGLGWVLVLERSDSTITAAGEIGVNMTHLTQTIDNLYGGNVPLDTAQYVDSDTGGLLLTASAVEVYTPSVPTTDAGTAVVVLTVEGVDEYTAGVTGVEYVDSATVTLALTPIIPITTRLLDDFNRANGSIGSNWSTPLLAESQTVLNIASNQAKSQDGTQADNYWNADIFTGDVEASVTVKDYAVGNIILLVINANLSTGSNYLAVIQPSGSGSTADYSIYRVNVSGSYSQIASASGPISVGSNVSLKRVGDTVLIRQNGVQVVSILDTSALSNTGALYVGLGASATQVRLDDFSVSAPAETFHGVDSAVGVLTLTAAGVELEEGVDTATASLLFTISGVDVHTLPSAAFPTTLLLDNFKRSVGVGTGVSNLGVGWQNNTLAMGSTPFIAHEIDGYLRTDYVSGARSDMWYGWQGFGPDCEEYYTVTQFSNSTTWKFGGHLRINSPAASSGVNGYAWEVKKSDNTVNIYRVTSGILTLLASASHTASLGIYGFSCVGDLMTVYKDGAPLVSVTETSYPGTSGVVVAGIWADVGSGATQDFHFENFGAGEIGYGSDSSDYSDLIIADGAMAYWRLGENNHGVARDFTNNGWTGLHTQLANDAPGAIVGDPDTANEFNPAVTHHIRVPLSGRDYIYHPTSCPGPGFSLEAWHYRPASVGDGPKDMGLMGTWDSTSGGGYMLWISFFTSGYGLTLNQTSSMYLDSSVVPRLNAWDHIVGTYEETSPTTGVKKLYINGTLILSDAHAPSAIGAGTVFNIASYSNSTGNTLAGVLDEAAVYQYALTAEQVLEHYQLGAVTAVEYEDSGTVTLNLDVVAAFPYGQPLLDSFNRADSTGLGSNWEHLVSSDTHWNISDGKMTGVAAYVNDAWIADFDVRNLFMWVEIAQLGDDDAYLFFATDVNTGTPDGYGIQFDENDLTILIRLIDNAITDFPIPTSATIPWAVGDLMGMALTDFDKQLIIYRKPVGESWREVLRGPIPALPGPVYPPVTQLAIAERPNSVTWQFTNFGGGSIPSAIWLDSLHSVEAATVGLVFTLSAVEEYTTVTGTEYSDSATASVLFTPGVASVAAGATLLDDFNRADAASLGSNWTRHLDWGTNRIAIVSNEASSVVNAPEADIWNPTTFGADQEVSVTLKAAAHDNSRFWLFMQVPGTGFGFTGYLCDISFEFSQIGGVIYRGNSGSYVNLGGGSSPYGGAPFGVGDTFTARKVGDQISILRNGVAYVTVTDPAPLSAPSGTYVGLGLNGSVISVDDFYGGTYGVSTSGETFQGVDAQTVGLVLTPSAVEARDRTDSATVPLAFTVSGTEVRDRTDAATVPFTFTVSAVEIRERSEAGTITLVLTASGTELELVVDSATASVIFTPSGVDDHSAGGVYTDAATASVLFTISSTEIAGVVDAQTVTATLTPSALEARISTDAATAAVVFTPSTIEAQEALDAATITVRVTGTTVEAKEAQDSATASLGLSPSAVVSFAAVDSALTTLVLSPSAVEDYFTGGVFTDAATARLTYTVTSTEAFAVSDSATASVSFTVTSVETYGRTDAATASVLFTPSGVDTYTTASAFTDTGTAAVLFSVTAVEGRERQDTGTATLALTVTYASAHGYTDATTAPLLLSGSALFERATISTATVPLAFTITSTEEVAQEDAATLYFRLTPKTALVFDNPLLLGVLSSTWRGGMQARSYSATVSSPGLSATVTAPRFTATVSTDMTGDIDSHFAGTIRR